MSLSPRTSESFLSVILVTHDRHAESHVQTHVTCCLVERGPVWMLRIWNMFKLRASWDNLGYRIYDNIMYMPVRGMFTKMFWFWQRYFVFRKVFTMRRTLHGLQILYRRWFRCVTCPKRIVSVKGSDRFRRSAFRRRSKCAPGWLFWVAQIIDFIITCSVPFRLGCTLACSNQIVKLVIPAYRTHAQTRQWQL